MFDILNRPLGQKQPAVLTFHSLFSDLLHEDGGVGGVQVTVSHIRDGSSLGR